ncbi:hypothetical protein SKAU_G00227500 [Synaphobranchus kaupii]|uniref:Heparan-sulfate 6-O-sulfotransferase n=1 Tax=Synaphobranchus kaupii TaxID=118154 RepID=A0A9Q1F4Z4_SYNKA|nr:hypothetical protein SKAU_G00227500 [Synaphobranchus kaupii]
MESNHSRLLLALVMVLLFGVIVLQYVCPGTDCQLLRLGSLSSKLGDSTSRGGGDHNDGDSGLDPYVAEDRTLARFIPRFNFTTGDLNRSVDFNIKGDDVIVFLHIQKTGGTTFGRHLVRNIQLERPCECHAGQKKCTCYRPGKRETWLFSRFSTGWSCGLHADWTELTTCVPSLMNTREPTKTQYAPSRNYYYITILRDPVWRYLSEWRHVQRGATWKASLHDFMDCPYNLANNRQTRMLADLSLVGCYNLTAMSEPERGAALLESAKRNLKGMAFFGLTEFQRKTQYLFERTFRLAFIAPFTQLNGTRAGAASVEAGPDAQRRIRQLNRWDVELYEYARDLFLQRFQWARQEERRQARERRQRERRRMRGRGQPWRRGREWPQGVEQQQQQQQQRAGADQATSTPADLGQEESKDRIRGHVPPPVSWWDPEENSTMADYLDNVEHW